MYNYFKYVHVFNGKLSRKVRDKSILLFIINRMYNYDSFQVTFSIRELSLLTGQCPRTAAYGLDSLVNTGILGKYVDSRTAIANAYYVKNELKDKAIQCEEIKYKELDMSFLDNYKYFTTCGMNNKGLMGLYELIKDNPGLKSKEMADRFNFNINSILSNLKKMVNRKMVERRRDSKSFRYYAIKEYYDIITDKSRVRVEDKNKEREVKFVQDRLNMIECLKKKKYLRLKSKYFQAQKNFKVIDHIRYYSGQLKRKINLSKLYNMFKDKEFFVSLDDFNRYRNNWFNLYRQSGILVI